MHFIQPKSTNKAKEAFEISQLTKLVIEYYAKYTGYSNDEIVDMFMLNILEDTNFITWLKKQRYNKKVKSIIFSENKQDYDAMTSEEKYKDEQIEEVIE